MYQSTTIGQKGYLLSHDQVVLDIQAEMLTKGAQKN